MSSGSELLNIRGPFLECYYHSFTVLGCFSAASCVEGGDGQCGDLFVRSMMGVQKGNAEGMNGGESSLAPFAVAALR